MRTTTMNRKCEGVTLNGWSRHEREDIQVHVSRNEKVHVALMVNNPKSKAIAVNMTPAEAIEFAQAILSAATMNDPRAEMLAQGWNENV